MSKVINKESFGYLGADFQLRLVAQLLIDKQFAESIIDIVNPNYFEDQSLKIIVSIIKEAHQEYGIIPDIGSLEFRLLDKVTNEFDQKYALQQLKAIKDVNLNDGLAVQDKAMRFCKQRELNKAIKEIQVIIDKGDISQYDYCEDVLKKAMEHGDNKDNTIDVTDNIEDVLADDFRKPIPTGILGLDEIMEGGLSKKELGIILAPFGVGKTTMMTKFANTALNLGYNVLQIFFEDMEKVIQRKHLACWSGYELNDLQFHKDELREIVKEKKSPNYGKLKLKKFSSDGTTMPMIRQYIRKKIAEGFRPDLILLDYIDCVQPSTKESDVNVGEGKVMRQFEAMLAELDMAGWTAVQGNRSSITADVVEANQMGGSIKKGQIGHFVLSIAKTLDQKEARTATMAILKSRFGRDGLIFQDILFDNARIQIDMGKNRGPKTNSEYTHDKGREESSYIANLLSAAQKRKQTTVNPMIQNETQ